jgi:hypothetical protein
MKPQWFLHLRSAGPQALSQHTVFQSNISSQSKRLLNSAPPPPEMLITHNEATKKKSAFDRSRETSGYSIPSTPVASPSSLCWQEATRTCKEILTCTSRLTGRHGLVSSTTHRYDFEWLSVVSWLQHTQPVWRESFTSPLPKNQFFADWEEANPYLAKLLLEQGDPSKSVTEVHWQCCVTLARKYCIKGCDGGESKMRFFQVCLLTRITHVLML